MSITLKQKLQVAFEKDPEVFCERDKTDQTLGSNPDYLKDIFYITKSDLIRLERKGLAVKARYETRHPKADHYDKLNEIRVKLDPPLSPLTCKTGTHRVRWLIFKEALQ